MTTARQPSERVRRGIVALFYLGLLFKVGIALGVDWLCGDWGRFRLGALNATIGATLTAGGLAFVSWSVYIQYTLGRGTPAPVAATLRLVTTGPYRCTRNPMTLGALALYLGIGLAVGSGSVLALTVIVFSLLLAHIRRHETRELTGRFGGDYLAYKASTPFLIPRCRGWVVR